MREIKFRGKRIDNGEWVCGDLIRGYKETRIGFFEVNEIGDEVYFSRQVIPESVSQFTGLHDKNGKEIYEGDIVNFYNRYTNKNYTRVVRYCPYFACFGLFPNMQEEWNYESDWLKISEVEVIGNIYEHPQLLNP